MAALGNEYSYHFGAAWNDVLRKTLINLGADLTPYREVVEELLDVHRKLPGHPPLGLHLIIEVCP